MFKVARIFDKKRVAALNRASKNFSTTSFNNKNYQCKLLVVGGGSGGCSMAAKLSKKLGKDSVIILEPADIHYFQPGFTLVGGGIKSLKNVYRPMAKVLPSKAIWLKDAAEKFEPVQMQVTTASGDVIQYEYMIVAVGLKLHFEQIPGLKEALDTPDSGVASIFDPEYAVNTWKNIQKIKGGDAIFTYPVGFIKCPGAPQKICYLTESYLTNAGLRSKVNITYNTSLPVLFGVKKYADALWKVVKKRDINVNLRNTLIEVNPDNKEAIFKNLDNDTISTSKYDMLHAVPPMSPPECLQECKELVDNNGYLDVDKYTLQHKKFPNIFGIGDCTNSPNSKTLAAVAVQSCVLTRNLCQVMKQLKCDKEYTGYASCPLITSYSTCILAEFDYDLEPMETFPFDQGCERYSMYIMKRDFMPFLYWKLMLRGYWNGPTVMRRCFHPRSCK